MDGAGNSLSLQPYGCDAQADALMTSLAMLDQALG
jgi:hypothetical protein